MELENLFRSDFDFSYKKKGTINRTIELIEEIVERNPLKELSYRLFFFFFFFVKEKRNSFGPRVGESANGA